jgi:hypothetical protein
LCGATSEVFYKKSLGHGEECIGSGATLREM